MHSYAYFILVDIIDKAFQMCYYHQHACLLVCLSLLPACPSVKLETSMDGSGHKGNIGQLLNSRVLGVLSVIALAMTQVSVCQSQSKLSQNQLTHALIQPGVIASNQCVRG